MQGVLEKVLETSEMHLSNQELVGPQHSNISPFCLVPTLVTQK